MKEFLSVLEKYDINYKDTFKRRVLTTLQVNIGNLCNQSCLHCHIDASPQGKNIMSKRVIDDILEYISKYRLEALDVTGGAPELNPHFDYFIVKARRLCKDVIVRSNLTVFFESGKGYLPEFFKKHKIHLICSLPCYSEENVDSQRGRGVFKKSIRAISLLNDYGYARDEGLPLDLVYNPLGAYLPPEQEKLEKDYRLNLRNEYGVEFNRLLTITNVPIKRFKATLEAAGQYNKYVELLKDSFNPDTIDNIMCRNFLSVGYNGKLYDCDFNQSLGWALKDGKGDFLTIENLSHEGLKGRKIMVGGHCFSCTAGLGSSCQGALAIAKVTEDRCKVAAEDSRDSVREYYGKILKTKKDLKTGACCSADSLPKELRNIIKKIEPRINDKFYGCGSPIPPLLEGRRVLDLGCGTGRDVYVASYLTGEKGVAIGVDMTDEQLEIARKYSDVQMKKFGFSRKNVEFKKGYIEDLKAVGIEDNSIDVVISNCVINLSPDKESVFREVFRVLKPGGELYFSDVFSDRRIPQYLKADPVLYGECLSGALYTEDFRRLFLKLGCSDYRIVKSKKITLNDAEVEDKAGAINFYSHTVRAFKLDLVDRCEDYGQIVVYSGTIPECPNKFILDVRHILLKGKPMVVCGNTADMLGKSRYGEHFKIIGDKANHCGLFNCSLAKNKDDASSSGACC